MADPIQPMPKPPMTTKQKVAVGGGVSASILALSLAVAGLKPDEGKRNITYLDLANLPTYCYGHLDRAAMVGGYHNDTQCDAILSTDVEAKLKAVEKCTPVLADRPYQIAAATRLAFNIGQGAYCKSGTARAFNAGNLKLGCQRFSGWVKVQGKTVKGLVMRRNREIEQCMKGL